jgi:carbamoylphosphate synthase large subunit
MQRCCMSSKHVVVAPMVTDSVLSHSDSDSHARALSLCLSQTILVNPNIASVQTSGNIADTIYSLPVSAEYVEQIIEHCQPDGIMLQFGGQTALNCGIELYSRGVLGRYGVAVLGTSIDSIIKTEDRSRFASEIESIGYGMNAIQSQRPNSNNHPNNHR